MMRKSREVNSVALTIAGFDPSGGAGIMADISAFNAFGCFPAAAITSLTFQNRTAVFGAEHMTASVVRQQVMAICADHTVACAKTGMLPTLEIVREVTRLFRETNLPAPVVDPVLSSTSGQALINADALEELLKELMPLARLVTPNIPEAERITGIRIEDEAGMREAARAIRKLGARAVLIKGGHLHERADSRRPAPREPDGIRAALDVLDDDGVVTTFRGDRIDGRNVRGTGCMLAAAIAACLASGMRLEDGVAEAKRFVSETIQRSCV
jgi:hydroxymethylpyrimidine/phosphomethylpyrimidine kinase